MAPESRRSRSWAISAAGERSTVLATCACAKTESSGGERRPGKLEHALPAKRGDAGREQSAEQEDPPPRAKRVRAAPENQQQKR